MKITQFGKITVDAEDFLVEGFHFKVEDQAPSQEKTTYELATLASLEWLEKRIAEMRAEIESGKAEISTSGIEWVQS